MPSAVHRAMLLGCLVMTFAGTMQGATVQAADETESEQAPKVDAGVKKFVDSWTQAFIAGDTRSMMKHYADRDDLRVTFSSGRQLSKFKAVASEYDASFKDGVFIESKLMKPVMRRVGNAAYVHGEHQLIMRFPDDPGKYRLHVRTTLVLERIEGEWQIVLEHSSTIENIPRIQAVQHLAPNPRLQPVSARGQHPHPPASF